MNPNIKAVIGEADMHSPTERAVLDREATPQGTTEPHGEVDAGNPEESKEVQLASQILAAIKAGDTAGAVRAANQLIQIHGQQPGAANPMGGHVQPVPHPQPPRALDYGPNSGGIGREA